jgi:hypothetical protein
LDQNLLIFDIVNFLIFLHKPPILIIINQIKADAFEESQPIPWNQVCPRLDADGLDLLSVNNFKTN